MTANFFADRRSELTYLPLHNHLVSLGYTLEDFPEPIPSDPPSRLERWHNDTTDLIVLTVNTGDWAVLKRVATNTDLSAQLRLVTESHNRSNNGAP